MKLTRQLNLLLPTGDYKNVTVITGATIDTDNPDDLKLIGSETGEDLKTIATKLLAFVEAESFEAKNALDNRSAKDFKSAHSR